LGRVALLLVQCRRPACVWTQGLQEAVPLLRILAVELTCTVKPQAARGWVTVHVDIVLHAEAVLVHLTMDQIGTVAATGAAGHSGAVGVALERMRVEEGKEKKWPLRDQERDLCRGQGL